jgi:hypothetical protein
MVRTLIGSVAGAGTGCFVAVVAVQIAAGGQPGSDAGPVTLFVGVFLAGAGAIAGAIIGGVADLVAFFKRKNQDPK